MSGLKLSITSWGQLAADKKALKALMRAAGNDVKNKTARMIALKTGTGRTYPGPGGAAYRGGYKPGAYTASAAGEPPVTVTGTLRQSLRTYPYKSGEGFAVRARMFYALFLESGARGGGNPGRGKGVINRRTGTAKRARGRYATRVLSPRPFLDVVMAQEAKNLDRRVGLAFEQGLT